MSATYDIDLPSYGPFSFRSSHSYHFDYHVVFMQYLWVTVRIPPAVRLPVIILPLLAVLVIMLCAPPLCSQKRILPTSLGCRLIELTAGTGN